MPGQRLVSKKISKVRERGQFTVPLEVRKALSWPEGEIPVKVTPLPEADGFRVERISVREKRRPRKQLTKKQWDEIREFMEKVSRMGKPVNLTEFLMKDRDSH